MILTRKKSTPPNPDKFPIAQLFVLALVRVAEPIAITSIFPYAWKLVLDFDFGDKNNASFYAGILISAFSLAEALTGFAWGGLSDRIGRKPVLLFGCAGTMISLLVVGFSTNFWVALFGRCLGGILNGNIGVVQTMVGEITVNPRHESRSYAVMPFVWSIGTVIGPSIGGYFASPVENFPSFFSPMSIFGKFPYLLPNLICAGMMLVSIVAGYFLLDETHPDMQPWSTHADRRYSVAETPIIPAQAGTTTAAADLRTESYGTFNRVIQEGVQEEWEVRADGRAGSISSQTDTKVFTRRVVMLVIALGIFTYHSMTYDHLLPIFLQDDRTGQGNVIADAFGPMAGGLGLSIQQVGIIVSISGLVALFIQAVVFPLVTATLGVWRVFMLVTALHPVALFIVPYLTLLPARCLFVGIYACLTIRNLFSILAYPVLLILIKEASPSASCLGKINGLAASTGAACRTMASPIAGLLYGIGIGINFTALAWWISALVALLGAVQAFFIRQKKNGDHYRVHAQAPCRFMPTENPRKDVVHIHVTDTDEGDRSAAI